MTQRSHKRIMPVQTGFGHRHKNKATDSQGWEVSMQTWIAQVRIGIVTHKTTPADIPDRITGFREEVNGKTFLIGTYPDTAIRSETTGFLIRLQ